MESMRIIKFRVYDKEGNIFTDNEPKGKMWPEEDFKNYYHTPIPYDKKYGSGKRWEVMQYTGLKDKNGKEIYEGDILKAGEDIMLVVWREDLASFALRKEEWMYDHYFGEAVDAGYCEIIGNIFSNPELLTTNP